MPSQRKSPSPTAPAQRDHIDDLIDEELIETFPASDPPGLSPRRDPVSPQPGVAPRVDRPDRPRSR